ncbi:MAG: M20 family metallopeptidase [Clostridia bacterium]|nr:M20 family metallopeptidase [Clostridia bacterium]
MIKINEGILKLNSEVVELRRRIHQYPERGFNEYKTSEFIKNKLKEYGVDEIHASAKTGVIGILRGINGAYTTAFRADIDGLPVQEDNTCDYKSLNEGCMHACGHDGHTAALLGFVKYAVQNRNQIKDHLVFIFQPAEEGPGGAEVMVSEGIIEKYRIDRIVGLHIFPEYPQGKVAAKAGALMARNGEVGITVKGQTAHGAMPHKGKDAIVTAANFVMAAQSLMSRNIDPMSSAVFTMGKINGGEAGNVIADEVHIVGTMRAFSDDVYDTLVKRIEDIAKGMGDAYDCEIKVDFNHMYRVVQNDEHLVSALQKAVGAEDFIEAKPAMISEDFSFFQQKVPGMFFFVGSYNEEAGYTHPLHSSKFNFNEDILMTAIQVYWNLLQEI